MHGPLLERLADYLSIDARPDRVIPEALGAGQCHAGVSPQPPLQLQSIGALGVIEMTAPTRAGFVDAGLKRLGIPTKKRIYFTLHAVLDIKHSECWNREVLRSLVGRNLVVPRPSARARSSACGTARVASTVIAGISLRRSTKIRRHNRRPSKMRFLGIGDAADLSALYLRLAEEGHDVKVCIAHPLCQETLAGLIERVRLAGELAWVRAAGDDGCILFENVARAAATLRIGLRREGYNVIGSSAYGARLENDRGYAQRVLAELGLPTAALFEFSDAAEAVRFVERPSRPLRAQGRTAPTHATFVGRHTDGRDVRAMLASERQALGRLQLRADGSRHRGGRDRASAAISTAASS